MEHLNPDRMSVPEGSERPLTSFPQLTRPLSSSSPMMHDGSMISSSSDYPQLMLLFRN